MKRPGVALATGLLVMSAGLSTPAYALDGATLYQKKTCIGCHGNDAKTPLLPIYPKLAGQNPDYAYNQMKDIANGVRANGYSGAMKGIMHLVTDEELRVIADWLGTLE